MEWRSEPRGNGSVVERIGIAKRSRKKVEEKACVPHFLLLRCSQMNEVFRYRSRSLNAEDIAGLRSLIAQNPTASRRKLSAIVCEAWGWRQSNGALCDMVCRSLMLALHRAGHIELPEKKQSRPTMGLRSADGRPLISFWIRARSNARLASCHPSQSDR